MSQVSAVWIVLAIVFGACTGSPRERRESFVVFSSPVSIEKLDPWKAKDLYELRELSYIYEGLYSYEWNGSKFILTPKLADKIPEISRDRKKYSIELKKGVVFHDDPCFQATQGRGRELVAEDVVFSLEKGWSADGSIERIEAEGQYRVRIALRQPDEQFMNRLTLASAYVVPREAVEYYQDGFGKNPVGTGPFRLDKDKTTFGNRMVYRKHALYRVDQPRVDRVETQHLVDSVILWEKFNRGELDFIEIPNDRIADVVNLAKELNSKYKSRGWRLIKEHAFDTTGIAFNLHDPLLGSNRKLRQALSMVFDAQKFIELFYAGRGTLSQGPVPPELRKLYSAKSDFLSNPYRQSSAEGAQKLLKSSGFPDGEGLPEWIFGVPNHSAYLAFAEFFKKRLSEIGIKIKITALSWAEFHEAILQKKLHLYPYSWVADYPDPVAFFELFNSLGNGGNVFGFKSEKYDQLLQKAKKGHSLLERKKIFLDLEKILIEESPWIWGAHQVHYYLVQPWLENFLIHPMNRFNASSFWVNTDLKRQID